MSKSEQKRICIQSKCVVRDELREQLDDSIERQKIASTNAQYYADMTVSLEAELLKANKVVEAAKLVSEYKSGRTIKIPVDYSELLFDLLFDLFSELEALAELNR